jgi:preprotein translocase subunit YajC
MIEASGWGGMTGLVLAQAGTAAGEAAAPVAPPTTGGSPLDSIRGGTTTTPGTTSTPGGAPLPPGQQQPQGIPPIFWLLPLFFVVLIVMNIMSSRRERKKRDALLSGMRKHDKVLTIGGIIGTIAEIRDDEVVIRIDENSNVRMRVTRSAIQQVIKSSDIDDEPTANSNVEIKTNKGVGVRA